MRTDKLGRVKWSVLGVHEWLELLGSLDSFEINGPTTTLYFSKGTKVTFENKKLLDEIGLCRKKPGKLIFTAHPRMDEKVTQGMTATHYYNFNLFAQHSILNFCKAKEKGENNNL